MITWYIYICVCMFVCSVLYSVCVDVQYIPRNMHTVFGFCFAVLCCGYTLTDFPISIRLTSLALWQSDDCPSASKATLMNKDKYLIWIHYERLHNHNKAQHNKTVCIFLGIYCIKTAINIPTTSYHLVNTYLPVTVSQNVSQRTEMLPHHV